jgi:aldehyde dehydrogenase (NAD+)
MKDFVKNLGIQALHSGAYAGEWLPCTGKVLTVTSPVDGKVIAEVQMAGAVEYEKVMQKTTETFKEWRMWPAPKRGEVVREIGESLRASKKELGRLVAYEMGKIVAEGEGEVQEMIDIVDFAVGLSRQLYGLTMHSERALHRMYEQWHPLGPIGVITAFNFPIAVWSWNAFLAMVCGDTVVWKPSSKTPLAAIAVQNICDSVLKKWGMEGVCTLVVGNRENVGNPMIHDKRFPLISATGSCAMGRTIGEACAKRFARTLLELGGNNGIIILKDADRDLALRAVLFGAVGTAGQRCTSTRRILIDQSIREEFIQSLVKAYQQVSIGDPLDPKTLMGPLIDKAAVQTMQEALKHAQAQGGKIRYGGEVLKGEAYASGCYVTPCIVEAHSKMAIVQEETFAPILYVIGVESLEEAIEVHNEVPQGLSSAIFTSNLYHSEKFLSAAGSDCGIANVNIGTSGAEIGGAFGGEKETGGGRESGSDSWKVYMRRQTCTLNWSRALPLAQGIHFGDFSKES